MPRDTQSPILLADYTRPNHLIDDVHLTFHLDPQKTRVISRITFRPERGGDLVLDGEALTLIWAKIDGAPVTPVVTNTGVTVPASALPDGVFVWEAEVEIAPAANTALEGLYMSNGMYCTQCEAEGFRKITYYPDRPDVMAPFTVRIQGDAPVILSNGNPQAQGEGWAEWHDPWPKPAYLFALVAGDLRAISGKFTTRSGKPVDLNIWVRPGDEDRGDYALDALIRSMKWDEDVYGREYDLDVFNIVAVDDFNMGAMENKGLNIFNSKYVLASPATATDTDYEFIESIIAHEYFHNWTGNRITCRDWFQLCLKEGLTVFRDQQFSADMRSAPVQRISDVLSLRARQFREDGGPLAHNVRPESYVEINNFYTATVYDKGAEVIGMLKRLVGDDGYAKALDLYFDRHDGDAATIEDWLAVFQDATGRDLSQFKRWYSQAGTPRLTMTETWADGTLTLTFAQETPPTPGQASKSPQVIPIAVGLIGPNGDEVQPTVVLEMTEAEQSFDFTGLSARPTVSALRGFSAPVVLNRSTSTAERAHLLAHDTDPFNRWEAGRTLAKDSLIAMITDGASPQTAYLDGLAQLLADEALDPAYRALMLGLPSQDDLAQTLFDGGVTPDPMAIYAALKTMRQAMADRLGQLLADLYDRHQITGAYAPDAAQAGKRSLTNAALGLLTRIDGGERAQAQFKAASNMTQQLGALVALLTNDLGEAEVAAFHDQWQGDRLVMDKWFMLQTAHAAPDKAAEVTQALTEHPAFDWKNPNRFRSVFGGLTSNAAGFHEASGASYRLLADWLLKLDPLNPQTAARMTGAFETWRRFDADRQALIEVELRRMLAAEGLSRDTTEKLTLILGA